MALLNFKQGLRMLLFVLLIVPALIVSAEINPTLGFMRMGQNWENITLLGLRGVTSAKGDDLFLDCEAPYPIRWNITGQIVSWFKFSFKIKSTVYKVEPENTESFLNAYKGATWNS